MPLDVMEKITQYKTMDVRALNANANGYCGSCLAGKWIVYAPAYETEDAGGSPNSTIAFFDTTKNIKDTTAWKFFDLSTINAAYKIYAYPSYDGSRYVYMAPVGEDTARHGFAVKIDMTNFEVAAGYQFFDTTALGAAFKGFSGCCICNGKVVYSPYFLGGVSYSGQLAMHDTSGDFTNIASWSGYDIAPINAYGYGSAVSDNQRYVYFIPLHRPALHGVLVRFDTQGPINDNGSYTVVNMAAFNAAWVGFNDACILNGYLYLFGHYKGGYNPSDIMVKVNLSGDITNVSAYTGFQIAETGFWMKATSDGSRYIYSVDDPSSYTYGKILRLDTQGTFADNASWKIVKTHPFYYRRSSGWNALTMANGRLYLGNDSFFNNGAFMEYNPIDRPSEQLEDVIWMFNGPALKKGGYITDKLTGNIPVYAIGEKRFTLTNFASGGYVGASGLLQFVSPGYISAPNTEYGEQLFLNGGQQDFTLEFIIKFNVFSTTTIQNYKLCDFYQGATRFVVLNAIGGASYADLRIEANTGVAKYVATADESFVNPTSVNHIVYSFAGGVTTIYLNGVELGYATRETMVGDIGLTNFYIGGTINGYHYAQMNMYMIAKRNGVMPLEKIQANAALVAAGDYSLGLKFNVDANGQVYLSNNNNGQSRLGIGFPSMGSRSRSRRR